MTAKLDPTLREGISGMWHYHLASNGAPLCGAWTMASHAPLATWGYRPKHMPSSYCKRCAELGALPIPAPEGE